MKYGQMMFVVLVDDFNLMNLMDSSQNHVVDHFLNSVGEEWRPSPADERGNTLWIQQATVGDPTCSPTAWRGGDGGRRFSAT